MSAPPFRSYLIVTVAAAGLALWLPFQLGGIHGYQSPALFLTIAWLALFALGVALYGRRALWLLLTSPPAIFWIVVLGGALICEAGRCG